MAAQISLSRRSFVGVAATMPLLAGSPDKQVPIGLELYSVREDLKRDPMAALRAVAKIGYQCVEFYAPYYQWTPGYAQQIRQRLDDLGMRCYSTHNGQDSFTPAGLPHAIDLNRILGSKYVVLASAAKPATLDNWKAVADNLSAASDKLRPAGLHAGYHNHQLEFTPLEGTRPIEVIAANTPKDFMLQLDVGTCIEAGSDPVAWIEQNPGRIRSLHCKDWSSDGGYKVLFGEGAAPWKKIFEAAEKVGGVEFYLIEQEGSAYPPMETAQRCLANFRSLKTKPTP